MEKLNLGAGTVEKNIDCSAERILAEFFSNQSIQRVHASAKIRILFSVRDNNESQRKGKASFQLGFNQGNIDELIKADPMATGMVDLKKRNSIAGDDY